MNVMTRQISLPLDRSITTAVRTLAMDAVENAKSGHPGAPMGLAEVAAVFGVATCAIIRQIPRQQMSRSLPVHSSYHLSGCAR
jgi:transketolase N-terminal domain/subunit